MNDKTERIAKAHQVEIKNRIDRIRAAVMMKTVGHCDWGDVGDLAHVNDELADIERFLGTLEED